MHSGCVLLVLVLDELGRDERLLPNPIEQNRHVADKSIGSTASRQDKAIDRIDRACSPSYDN